MKSNYTYKSVQHEEELAFILENCNGKTNFIEIGTNCGGTFIELSKIIKGKKISVDLEYKNEAQRIDFKKRNEALKIDFPDSILITGDSHKIETLNQVKEALNGELVDVLFIDGDHTYEGVKQDYFLYKHLVSDKGLIIFHDVIDSNFHRTNNCYVSKFWNELNGNKKQLSVSNEWGGVGIISNSRITWEAFQIYYDENSKKEINKSLFTPYFNDEKNTEWYENDVILDVCNKLDSIKSDFIGVVSWKLEQKTNFKEIEFRQKIEEQLKTNDVIFFPPFYHIKENWVENNKRDFAGIYGGCRIIDKYNFLPFKTDGSDKWSVSYCHYWIARKEVFKKYVETVLIPLKNFCESNEEMITYCNKNLFKHGGKMVKIYPFLAEIMMGFFVNKFNINNSIIIPDSAETYLKNKQELKSLPMKNVLTKIIQGNFRHYNIGAVGTIDIMPMADAVILQRKGLIKIINMENENIRFKTKVQFSYGRVYLAGEEGEMPFRIANKFSQNGYVELIDPDVQVEKEVVVEKPIEKIEVVEIKNKMVEEPENKELREVFENKKEVKTSKKETKKAKK